MKKIFAFILVTVLLAAPAVFAADGFPLTVAGITLGQDYKKYTECCDVNLASPMPDAPFLTEMHIKSDTIPGIRGGSLAYANCDQKGKLTRIKLKFHDRSQKLFNELLKKYEKTYGKADSYQGDAFRNVVAWEWDFTRGDERITLILMWSRVNDIRPGVSIKMTLSSLLDSEYSCYKAKKAKISRGKGGPTEIKNLNNFIPR